GVPDPGEPISRNHRPVRPAVDRPDLSSRRTKPLESVPSWRAKRTGNDYRSRAPVHPALASEEEEVNVDIVLGLLGTAASLAGLAWNRDGFRRLALVLLTLLGLSLLLIGVVQRRAIQRVEDQIAQDGHVCDERRSAPRAREH